MEQTHNHKYNVTIKIITFGYISSVQIITSANDLWTVTDLSVDYISGNIYWLDADKVILSASDHLSVVNKQSFAEH